MKKADGVFEGGGVKGIGLVGSLTVFEDEGYTDWQRVAGTSSGAIVASLLAAGYSALELQDLIMDLDYGQLLDYTTRWDILSHPFSIILGLLRDYGVNESTPLVSWLEERLHNKGVETFADLRTRSQENEYRYRLRIIASDISNRNMLVLPQEVRRYGEDPDRLSVARAVGMSLLFPVFFKPKRLNGSFVVDGGILSNFPVWLFDRQEVPRFPTFGFKLLENNQPIHGPLSFLRELFYTTLEAHDNEHQEGSNAVRTVPIPSDGINPLSFNLSAGDKRKLFESGRDSARRFLKGWDFEGYKKEFRK
ncbi:MAG: patatin-like phospholipase family protein [Candidatus Acetothermia bacterium]